MTSNISEKIDPIFDLATAIYSSEEFALMIENVTKYMPLEDLENAYSALESWLYDDFLPNANFSITYENDDEFGFEWYAIETNTGVSISISEELTDGASFYELTVEDSNDLFDWDYFSFGNLSIGESQTYVGTSLEMDNGDAALLTFRGWDDPIYTLSLIANDLVTEDLSDLVGVSYIAENDLPWTIAAFGDDGSFDWGDLSGDLFEALDVYYPSTLRTDVDVITDFELRLDGDADLREVDVTYVDGVQYTAELSDTGDVTETFDDAADVFDWSTQTIAFDNAGGADVSVVMDNGVSLSASGTMAGGTARMLDLADAFEWSESKVSVGEDGDIDTMWTRFDDGTTAYVTFADSGATHATVKDNSDLYDWDRLTIYTNAQGGVSARADWDNGTSEALNALNLPLDLAAYDMAEIETVFAEIADDVMTVFV